MMKIAILGRWNATCGASLHAELIGREFIKMGYELIVFAPTFKSANKWWHHKIIMEDEDFVIRAYEEDDPRGGSGKIYTEKILSENFDFLIVESYKGLPCREVERILPEIKKRSKVIIVLHEGKKEDLKYRNIEEFDAVVVFDRRYIDEVCNAKNVYVIPYPCYPLTRPREVKRREAKKIFFSFGRQPEFEYMDYIKALRELRSRYDLVYRIVRSNGMLHVKERWIEQIRKRLTIEEIYDFLNRSDIHLLPKGSTESVVVSSTVYQCLGSLCPIIAPKARYFETLPEEHGVKPVVLYTDIEDLKGKIVRLLEDDSYRNAVLRAAEKFVKENSSEVVAKKFIELYQKL